MKMRPGRVAGRADLADHLPFRDPLRREDVKARQMAVAGAYTSRMLDFDQVSVAPGPPRDPHNAGSGRHHSRAVVARQIDPGVTATDSGDRVGSPAKPRGNGKPIQPRAARANL